jgi:hypothetical protein
MSERDASRGGMYEPSIPSGIGRGEGLTHTGKCDECHVNVSTRRPAKVLRGALRGMRGMVCRGCASLRQPAKEVSA